MKLHEYQSKTIFAKYGIPIPKGRVAATADEAKQIAKELGSRVVIKSQVLVGGRGKAGGIRLAKSPEEAGELAGQILAMEIKGLPVRKVLMAGALASGAPLTLIDEPVAGLDKPSIQYLARALTSVAAQPGRLVVVAHYETLAGVPWGTVVDLART